MVYEKGRSFMTNKEIKKMEAKKAAREQALQEDIRAEELKEEQELLRAGDEPIEMKLRDGKGGHHCSYMDGPGKSHRTSPDCFRHRHMGVCPICHYPRSAIKGCKKCELLGEELEFDNISFPLKLQAQFLIQDGVDRLKKLVPWSHGKGK